MFKIRACGEEERDRDFGLGWSGKGLKIRDIIVEDVNPSIDPSYVFKVVFVGV